MIEVDAADVPCALHGATCGAVDADSCPVERRVLASLAPVVVAPAVPKVKPPTPEEVAFAEALAQLEAMFAEPAPLPVAAPAASPAPRPRLASWKHLPSR